MSRHAKNFDQTEFLSYLVEDEKLLKHTINYGIKLAT